MRGGLASQKRINDIGSLYISPAQPAPPLCGRVSQRTRFLCALPFYSTPPTLSDKLLAAFDTQDDIRIDPVGQGEDRKGK